MMPKLDRIAMLPRVRAITQAPIFIVSAKGETEDKVLGLERGADQYVAKPFETPELIARIRSALRHPPLDTPEMFSLRRSPNESHERTARRGSSQARLTAREFTSTSYSRTRTATGVQ